jgi:uncharacterized protein (TIGR00369 family)
MMALTQTLAIAQEAPGRFVRKAWDQLQTWPGGKRVFSQMIGFSAPYAATIRPQVQDLRSGYARVLMPYHRGIRNHIGCVHAAALFNLVEFTANMALAYTIPDDARFIVSGMSMDYLKKARGDVTGICECPEIISSTRHPLELVVTLRDETAQVIARGNTRALVGPRRRAA